MFLKAERARPRVWNVWVADVATGSLSQVSCHSTQLLLGGPLGEATLSAIPLLQVAGCQTGVLGDSGEHARAQFLVVMKGEDEVRPIRPRERTGVRSSPRIVSRSCRCPRVTTTA